MDVTTVAELAAHYRAHALQLDRTIHDSDDMFLKDGWDNYLLVGRSAIDVILDSLVAAPLTVVNSVLDFGCGHGRVARHLRILFPEADLLFSDVDESGWRFCAQQFAGTGFPSSDDVGLVEIPRVADIVFLGSVFTHLEEGRCRKLWAKMFEALAPGGALIATFRGAAAYRMMLTTPERFNQGGYYRQLLDDYVRDGFGYQDYKGFVSWGQNLFSIARVVGLAGDEQRARLVGYKEAGWANIHDVAVWTKK